MQLPIVNSISIKVGDKLNLEENLIRYKDITLTILEFVKIEEYEKLDEIFQKRQLILDDMNKINYSKEEIQRLYLQYGIEKLNKTLETEMKSRQKNLMMKIKENTKKQAGLSGYNKISATAVFLSKKI